MNDYWISGAMMGYWIGWFAHAGIIKFANWLAKGDARNEKNNN